jgi:hypothetical protein
MRLQMKISSQLLAAMALSVALSSPALAKHHHHHNAAHAHTAGKARGASGGPTAGRNAGPSDAPAIATGDTPGKGDHLTPKVGSSGSHDSGTDNAGGKDDLPPKNGGDAKRDVNSSISPAGGADGDHQRSGLDSNPIDTSITVNQGPETGRNHGAYLFGKRTTFSTVKPIAALPTGGSEAEIPALGGTKYRWLLVHRHEFPAGLERESHRNAIGAREKQDQGGVQRNAVGSLVLPGHHVVAMRSATGDMMPPLGNAAGPQVKPDTTPRNNPAPNIATLKIFRMGGLSINRTGLDRPAYGTAGIGGPPQIDRGVLSGNMFHPKHP